ncbi:MAG: PDZ domain-containing protein [Rhodothermales bacterium]|nr:PDZ domain-containing protein [Rhodothermales bacterium]
MRLATILLAPLFAASLLAPPAAGQAFTFEADQNNPIAMMQVPGGMVVVRGGSEVRIERVLYPPSVAQADKLDLTEGDLILYINGERVGSAEEVNTRFAALEVGSEVKVGIQRGEQKMIRTFNKPEPQSGNVSGGFQFIESGGGEMLANVVLWPAGFVVGEKEGAVVVENVMPLPDKAPELAPIEAGDVIVSLNAKYITTTAELIEWYEAIPVGESVKVEVEKKGIGSIIVFSKRQAPQMKLMIENN